MHFEGLLGAFLGDTPVDRTYYLSQKLARKCPHSSHLLGNLTRIYVAESTNRYLQGEHHDRSQGF